MSRLIRAITLALSTPLIVAQPAGAQFITARDIYEWSEISPPGASLYLAGVVAAYARICGMDGDPLDVPVGDFLIRYRVDYLNAVATHGFAAEEQAVTVFAFYVFETFEGSRKRRGTRRCGPYEDLRHLAREPFDGPLIQDLPDEILERYPSLR